MPKIKRSDKKHASKNTERANIAEQILEDKSLRVPGRSKTRNRNDDDDNQYADVKLSTKILRQAREQQEELAEEHGLYSLPEKTKRTVTLHTTGSRSDSEDEEDQMSDVDEFYEQIDIDEKEEEALEKFMSKNEQTKRTLADIIQEKLTEKQTEIRSQLSDNASLRIEELDERVVVMYRSIRDVLSCYRSGKLPKAFKIIPVLSNWEQILYLTEPDKWTAAAMYQATRIFASNLNAKMAQRFFNLVLLPRVRDDIAEYKRLNFHLYMALSKALFKPAAFFKGILLPLCKSGSCNLREATIISSILTKNSIPVLHSAAAMLKIAEMNYSGANSIFLKTLLDKKYALPYRVIDALVFHFLRFNSDEREMPVLWHQCLLTLTQRYKEDISSEQKEALLQLLTVHVHHQITPEIRRELVNSKCREETVNEPTEMQTN